jgi:ketosteroid isomerase-like protein
MRFSTAVLTPLLSIGLIASALAQEVEQQTRQQIEAAHTKWIDAINSGDANTVLSLSAPNVISIDAFGRTMPSRIAELIEMVHKKGIMLSFPIEGIELIKDGTVVAYGSFTSKYTDPNIPPGQGNWVQVFERDGDSWRQLENSSLCRLQIYARRASTAVQSRQTTGIGI